jgi:hypothetical protein
MGLDAALGEEPQGGARVGAVWHAEDLDFHYRCERSMATPPSPGNRAGARDGRSLTAR